MLDSIRNFFMHLAEIGALPDYFKYAFVINSLLSALFIGPILGGLGTMVVTKRMAFFSESIGHAALTGIALGVLLGEPYESPYIMLFTYCVVFAILINFTRNRTKMSSDTLIGIFLSISIALGGTLIIFVSSKVNSHMLESVLFGSILTVSDRDLLVLFFSTILLILIVIPNFNKMLLSSFNTNVAVVKGVRVKLLEYLFILLITLVTVSSIKIIGASLVEALFLIPAASAKNLSKSIKSFFVYSIIFALISCILGILLPLYFDVTIPSGGSIILIAAVIFFITVIIKNLKRSLI
ncbi:MULTISPECIES: metal ABC transporter permease [Sneathia]|uniref:Zinc ABC transporter permease n=1 Tax=Sneathia vaginalis TaxID=187101 RepID=A0A0E3UU67_9FUSO|nr:MULTISPECIES: metal ABC transporter permease [Sneathia]AKC95018.1 zinc ABC transporter permease [Sneathia vaginalis]MBE3031157.1 metal ABC transporter permease [Sneathia sp. DSM 16631]MDK9581607.1 metal ABC transporter permease [Sneathia vaginalis]